jgi:hypothetical protein
MEYVMRQMCWSYSTLMGCIYGLAQPGKIEESWVEKWLDKQILIIAEMANCKNGRGPEFVKAWQEAFDFQYACAKIGGTPRLIYEQALRYRLLGVELKKLDGEPNYEV